MTVRTFCGMTRVWMLLSLTLLASAGAVLGQTAVSSTGSVPRLSATGRNLGAGPTNQVKPAAVKPAPSPAPVVVPAKTTTAAPAQTTTVAAVASATPGVAPTAPLDEASGARVAYRLRPLDPVIIFLRGILPKDDQIEDIIDEAGYVKLPYLDNVLAAGKTTSELESEIQRLYVDRQIYKSINVNVVVPSQSYFVRGEVRTAGRYALMTGVKLMQAIAAAGGYTEFADPTKVLLTRGDQVSVINMKEIERSPERDIQVEPGDVIVVKRSIW